MLKAQLDLSVPCPHTQDFQPCMAPGCSVEGKKKILILCTEVERGREPWSLCILLSKDGGIMVSL